MSEETSLQRVSVTPRVVVALQAIRSAHPPATHLLIADAAGPEGVVVLSKGQYDELLSDALMTRHPDWFGLKWVDTPDAIEDAGVKLEDVLP